MALIILWLLVVYGAFYLFTAFGLSTMSKRQNIELGWLAWVPFAQYVLMGKLAKKEGGKSETLGLALACTSFACFAALILTAVFLKDNTLSLVFGLSYAALFLADAAVKIFLCIDFYQKFNPFSTKSCTILSATLQLQGIFIFAVRFNNPYDPYATYVEFGKVFNYGQNKPKEGEEITETESEFVQQ